MKVSFEYEIAHNYVIPQPDEAQMRGNGEGEKEYEIHMLEKNHIPGFLGCIRKRINGRTQYYYEITSRQSLAQICKTEELRAEDIRMLLRSLYDALLQTDQYLLDGNKMVLDPELIYMDIESREAKFCYLPSYENNIQDSFRILAAYLLYHLDQTDTEAVLQVYEMNREVQETYYALMEVLRTYSAGEKRRTGSEETKRCPQREPVEKELETAQQAGQEKSEKSSLFWTERQEEKEKREKKEKKEKTEKTPCAEKKRWTDRLKQRRNGMFRGVNREKRKQEGQAAKKEHAGENTNQKKKEEKGRVLMGVVFLVVIGITGAAAWMEMLTITQAGGIAFLLFGGMWYLLAAEKKRKNLDGSGRNGTEKFGKKKKEPEIKWEMPMEQGETENIEALKKPAFAQKSVSAQNPLSAQNLEEPVTGWEERMGETTVLRKGTGEYVPHMTLISMNTRERNSVVLMKERYLIGKLKTKVDICIDHPAVSRVHAKIEKEGEEYCLYDMNSTNGTFLNGKRLGVNEKMVLHVADEITFAGVGYYVGMC